jgi:Carboxypeptidase regulatory-like domain
MTHLHRLGLILAVVAFLSPSQALAQGETTSAIVGQVRDTTNAVVPGATVAIANLETGLRRSAKTDDAGRFNFPQLKPGTYSVKAEAQGFEPQQNDNVISGLGQKQTVDFSLRVARSNETVEVNSEAPLINPENANTSTTLNTSALEDLPNPGGDLTYPLQFSPGALINTAGSGNDFVGGTNGYGNVEFNGLPALSNGYIVDGLETNDPLTNLNSGLSTNLVLGLNSISEVTVNTLSYSVDQGRYGASQVNYVTKSGTNQFHGNLYELWNGSLLNTADYFTNATPGNHKPGATVNHFGGSVGGPIAHDKLFFFFDSEWVRIALPIVTPTIVPSTAFQAYVLRQLSGGQTTGCGSSDPNENCLFYQQMFNLYRNAGGTPTAILGCPLGAAGDGCANRQSISHSSDDHEGPDHPSRLQHQPERYGMASFSVGHWAAIRVHGSHQPSVQCAFAATSLFVRRRTHTRFLAEPGELLQPGVLVV